MSLTVTSDILDRAERGQLSLADFVEVVRGSLPYFFTRVETLAGALATVSLATNDETPATSADWGQLLRGFASDPIRSAMERHFGIKLGFRNCCYAAATQPGGETAVAWTELFTLRAQILAQSPELADC